MCVAAVCLLCGCHFLDSTGSEIERDARERLDESSQKFVTMADGVVKDARDPGPGAYCFNSGDWTHCFDGTGYGIRNHLNEVTVEDSYLWRSKTTAYGDAVYQPRDDGRMFFHLRTPDGVLYWIVYDPQGRDVADWLAKRGFSHVGSYSDKFAYAGRIVDQRQRAEFWIWVKHRQERLAEFEKQYPHLAAPELSKEPG